MDQSALLSMSETYIEYWRCGSAGRKRHLSIRNMFNSIRIPVIIAKTK